MTWQEYYLKLAETIALKSKDTNKVGCVLVNSNNEPLGIGYNGPPRILDDNLVDWNRPNKYKYILHAEDNAILHSKGTPYYCYCTLKPCGSCTCRLIQFGVRKIIYNLSNMLLLDEHSMMRNNTDCEDICELTKGLVTVQGVHIEH